MKKIAILMTAVLCLVLAGCAKEPVDYVEENTQESVGNNGTLAEQFGKDKWKEDLLMTGADGAQIPVEINAKTTVPNADQMSVVEVKQYKMDETGKEEFLNNLFGNQIYYYDLAYKQKEDFEVLLTELQMKLDGAQETLETEGEHLQDAAPSIYNEEMEIIRECQDAMDSYKQMMAVAPTSYTKAEDFSGEEYLGMIGDTEYAVTIHEVVDNIPYDPGYIENPSVAIEIMPKNKNYFSYNSGYYHTEYLPGGYQSPEVEGLTEEEARTQAEKFLEDIGLSWYVQTDTKIVEWWNDDSEAKDCGYVFTYEPGVDGIGFTSLGNCEEYYYIEKASSFSDYAFVKVYVTPEDGLMVYLLNPVEMISRLDKVKLLDLEIIKNIMRNTITAEDSEELLTHMGYFEDGLISLNDFSLIYLRIWDGDAESSYTYVPVWRLCDKGSTGDMSQILFVNAMDGSVIDPSSDY